MGGLIPSTLVLVKHLICIHSVTSEVTAQSQPPSNFHG